MKRLLTLIAALAVATSYVLGANVRDAIVEKLLALKAKELITPALTTKIVTAGHNFADSTATFHAAYYECRQKAYDASFNGSRVEQEDGNKPWQWNRYYYLRTLVVSKLKAELHQGTALQDIYTQVRPDLMKTLATRSVEFRQNLLKTIKVGVQAFTFVQDKTYRENFTAFIALEDKDQAENSKLVSMEAMLAKHKPAEEIAKFNETEEEELATPAFTPLPDIDFAKFALRRYNEGSDVLVKTYLAILKMAQADVEASLREPLKK